MTSYVSMRVFEISLEIQNELTALIIERLDYLAIHTWLNTFLIIIIFVLLLNRS